MKHGIASSSAYGARCTCGHIERSTLGRLVALNQLMDHMDDADKRSHRVIPEAAVGAAAKVLLGYTGACVCHEGYSGRDLIDPDCRYHDVPPEVAREILEAAAPHIESAMLEAGWQVPEKPYRSDS